MLTYMTHLDTNPLIAKQINLQTNFQIQHDALEGNAQGQQDLGLLHLRAFDMWINELRKHSKYLQEKGNAQEKENAVNPLKVIDSWYAHVPNRSQEETEEEIKVSRLGGAFKSSQRKLEIGLAVGTPTWVLWKQVMVHCKGRKLSGIEPKGAQERIIQDYADLLPRTS